MIYLSWAVMYEGASDAAYFDVLIPRVMQNLVETEGERHSNIPTGPAVHLGADGRAIDDVANEACAAKDAFHIVFIHADTGGRGLETGIASRSLAYCEAMHACCDWPCRRCVVIAPRHETEAWVLADPDAVMGALGYNGKFQEIGLPSGAGQAERLSDPKVTLLEAVTNVRGKRKQIYIEQIFPAIAQRQRIDMLRKSQSFISFENSLRGALQDLGACARTA